MNIRSSQLDCEDGMKRALGGTGARSLGKLSTSSTLVRGCQGRRETRQGAVAEEGYQIVTRAKGKPKKAAKAAATRAKPGA